MGHEHPVWTVYEDEQYVPLSDNTHRLTKDRDQKPFNTVQLVKLAVAFHHVAARTFQTPKMRPWEDRSRSRPCSLRRPEPERRTRLSRHRVVTRVRCAGRSPGAPSKLLRLCGATLTSYCSFLPTYPASLPIATSISSPGMMTRSAVLCATFCDD